MRGRGGFGRRGALAVLSWLAVGACLAAGAAQASSRSSYSVDLHVNVPPPMRVGGTSTVTFQVTNTGVYDLNDAYMVLGYDPALISGFEDCTPAPFVPGRPAGSCAIPLLRNAETYSYTARFTALAVGTARFTLSVQDADGATAVASA